MSWLILLVQAAWLLTFASLMYRLLAWSLDSPVLRAALRNRRFGLLTRLGLLLATAGTVWLIALLGGGQFTIATLVFGVMCQVFAVGAVLFCGFVLVDVREVFLSVAGKLRGAKEVGRWRDGPPAPCGPEQHQCAPARTCGVTAPACRERTFSHAWPSTERRRSRQRR